MLYYTIIYYTKPLYLFNGSADAADPKYLTSLQSTRRWRAQNQSRHATGPGRLSCACPASPCCAWAATGGVERVILAGSLDVVLGLPVELRQKGGAIQAWRDPNALS